MKQIFGLLSALCLLAACAVGTAETPQQKAFALYGTFVTVEEAAATIVLNPTTPDGVVEIIAKTDAVAKPLADAMLEAANAYSLIVAKIEEIEGRGEKPTDELLDLAITALAALTAAIVEAEPSIQALVAAIRAYGGD